MRKPLPPLSSPHHAYGNRHPDSYTDMVEVFRKKFFTGKTLHETEKKIVACHIRRGDVNPVIYEPFYHKPLSSWFNCDEQLADNQRFITGIKKQSCH